MQQLFTRAISGLVYAFVVLAATFSPPYGPVFLAAFLGAAAIIEWLNFKEHKDISRPAALMLGIFFLSIYRFSGRFAFDTNQSQTSELILAVFVVVLALTQVFTKKRKVPAALFHSFFGLIYITVPLCLLSGFSWYQSQDDPWLLAGVFILIWSADTFAYLVGKYLGRHKLLPSISPNKTWEGFIGSVVMTLLVAIVLSHTIDNQPTWVWLGLASVVIIFGAIGDLFESAIKRSFDLKDSGKFMPGHGGILDRIDSLLFALPMAYYYLKAIETYL